MRHTFRVRGKDVLHAVEPYLQDADFALANLETVVSDHGLRKYWLPSYEMRGNPETLQILKDAGFDIVGVANNHAMQHGQSAFFDTLTRIKAVGMQVVGVDGKPGKTCPIEIESGGVKHTVFAVSQRPEEWHTGPVPYSLRLDLDQLVEEAAALRRSCEGFLVCSIHWGLEFLTVPGPDQVAAGRRLVDAGVDVVLGHHSHFLQPVEKYKHGLIFYSLGNFVFDLWHEEAKLGVIAKVYLRKGQLPHYELVPITIDENFCLNLAGDAESARIMGFMKEHPSSYFDEIEKQDSAAYFGQYDRARRAAKPAMYRYFLRNALRYSPNFFLQSIARTALRRLSGR